MLLVRQLKILTAFLAFLGAMPVLAQTLTQNTSASTGSGITYPGQSFTISAAGNYTNIRFNFYDITGVAAAPGELYILSQPYTGLPSDLGAAAGRVGVSTSNAGGVYSFSPTVSLAGNTQYYTYATASPASALAVSGNSTTGDTYTGGTRWIASSAQPSNYRDRGALFEDYQFRVSQVGAAPEPMAWLLLIFGFGITGAALRQRKRKKNNGRLEGAPA